MIAKIAPVDSQKRWNEKFVDILKELDLSESNLKTSCQQLNAVRVRFRLFVLFSKQFEKSQNCRPINFRLVFIHYDCRTFFWPMSRVPLRNAKHSK